jgi:MFS family permease
MTERDRPVRDAIVRFSPLWLFLVFFKFGAGLHYSLLSPLGERVLPLWLAGIVMGLASFFQFALDVPAGKLLDRFGYRRLMLLGTVIFLFAALVLTFPFTLPTYLLSVALSVFGWLFFGPGVNAYLLSTASQKHSGFFMSLRDISGSLGIVLSSGFLPLTLLLPVAQMGWTIFGLLILSLISLSALPRETRSVRVEEHHHKRRLTRELKGLVQTMKQLNPASSVLLALHAVGAIFYGMIWFVVPLVIASQPHNELLGIGLGIFDFSIVALGFLLGMLADRANKRQLVFFGLLMFSIFGALLGVSFNVFFILFGFLATTGDEMAGLSLWSWLHILDREHTQDGTISGVISLFEDFGWMAGPIAAGFLYTLIGPSWTIALGALPIFITWFVYLVMSRGHAGQHPTIPSALRPRIRRHKS